MVKYTDLEVGTLMEFKATEKGFAGKLKEKGGILDAINLADQFTRLTSREISLVLYSPMQNLFGGWVCPNVICPSFGKEDGVVPGIFDENHRLNERRGEVYVPVFDLHTHIKKYFPFPSEEDLTGNLERDYTLSENGYSIVFEGDLINLVQENLDNKIHLFFFQFNGDVSGFRRFLLHKSLPTPRRGISGTEFSAQLEKTGFFKTLYYIHRGKRMESPSCKGLIEKVGKKFDFKFTVRRTS